MRLLASLGAILGTTAATLLAGPDPWEKADSRDPSAFERSGGLAPHGGLWSAADVDQPGCDYRFQIWQGTPPFGAPERPTLADYGHGFKPTYLRFEVRSGMKNGTQAEGFDPRDDEWEGDFRRPDRDQDGRLRIERSLNRKDVRVTGPSAIIHGYEVNFYLEPGWSGGYLGTLPQKTKVSIAQIPFAGDKPVVPTSIFVTTGHDRGKLITVQSDLASGHWTDTLEKYVGRWVRVRVEIVFQDNDRGSLKVFVDGQSVRQFTGLSTWKTQAAYMKYGLYLTRTKGVPPSAFFDIESGRKTVVWYTGLRYDRK